MSETDVSLSGWIDRRERDPTPEDADEQGCVLAWHRYDGVVVLHIRNMMNFGTFITHWMPTPAAP